jgi:hypothetical protein
MNETLPLFQELEDQELEDQELEDQELEDQELEAPSSAPTSSGDAARAAGQPPAPHGRARHRVAASDKHLRAAWRLSRAMGRFRDRSPEQTRAGVAICHHLQALLTQTDTRATR